METKLTAKRQILFLALLCSVTYFVGYLNRQNYSAVLVEIISCEGYSKTAASAALTTLFISYGIGQIVSGYLCEYFRPARVIGVGVFISAVMNLLIPLCKDTVAMVTVWCVNGFGQALLWPPMVQLMTMLLPMQDYQEKSFWISWSGHLGTMAVYLLAPMLIRVSGWRAMFLVSGAVALVMTVVWFWGMRKVEHWAAPVLGSRHRTENSKAEQETKHSIPRAMLVVLAVVMLAIVLQGILRDGIHSWLPTYFSETFHVESSTAIFGGLVMPVFSLVCSIVTSWLYRKVISNELVAASLIFAVAAVACGLVLFVGSSSPALALTMLALASGCASGVNMLLIVQVPAHFRDTGHVSTIAGVLNACTYIGSCISTYGIAVITERSGWDATLLIWTLSAITGMVLCLVLIRRWTKFRKINK